MLMFYTDFGYGGWYAGQMEAVCQMMAPTLPRVVLTHDAPRCDPRAASLLLAALLASMPGQERVVVCVVDPSVGSARRALVGRGKGCWFVGPDNGLMVAAAGSDADWFQLDWRPDQVADTFHGRDLFAPAAVQLALGVSIAMTPIDDPVGLDWSQSLAQVIAIDAFGNVITGLQAKTFPDDAKVRLGEATIRYARCFSAVAPDALFWYRNSIGLIEIAANGSNAARLLKVKHGDLLSFS